MYHNTDDFISQQYPLEQRFLFIERFGFLSVYEWFLISLAKTDQVDSKYEVWNACIIYGSICNFKVTIATYICNIST